MSFALHHGQQCVLCSGCEDDQEFDYCRACGFTKLPIDKQLREQLAKAQAAIKAVNEVLDEYGESEQPAVHTLSLIEGLLEHVSDTSALDAAIAEAQQPLVDALKRIADGDGMPADTLQSIAEHALAKVKEGK